MKWEVEPTKLILENGFISGEGGEVLAAFGDLRYLTILRSPTNISYYIIYNKQKSMQALCVCF